jgi:hypothetical protein
LEKSTLSPFIPGGGFSKGGTLLFGQLRPSLVNAAEPIDMTYHNAHVAMHAADGCDQILRIPRLNLSLSPTLRIWPLLATSGHIWPWRRAISGPVMEHGLTTP